MDRIRLRGSRRRWIAAALLVLAATACRGASTTLEERHTFRESTGTHTVEAMIGAGARQVSLDLSIEVDEGDVSFAVYDPGGIVRWEGDLASGGRLTDRRTFDAVAGEWRLELSMTSATGQSTASWKG